MKSSSLTALPSAVTIIKKKSHTYFKCCCRSIDKVISIVLFLASIVLLGVACGTRSWIQFSVQNNATQDRGTIELGLLQGSHSIRYGESPIANFINETYFLFNKFSNSHLARFYGTLGFSVGAMLISLLGILVTLVNSYQTITTWWKGPPMIYTLSFIAGFFGVVAVVLFADYYLWALNTVNLFVGVTTLSQQSAFIINNLTLDSFEYLISEEGYTLTPMLHYSFILEVAGACLPLVVTLIAWRMALKLPVAKSHVQPLSTNQHSNPLVMQSGFGGTPEPSSFNYEKVTRSKARGNRGGISHQTKKVDISHKVEILY